MQIQFLHRNYAVVGYSNRKKVSLSNLPKIIDLTEENSFTFNEGCIKGKNPRLQ